MKKTALGSECEEKRVQCKRFNHTKEYLMSKLRQQNHLRGSMSYNWTLPVLHERRETQREENLFPCNHECHLWLL